MKKILLIAIAILTAIGIVVAVEMYKSPVPVLSIGLVAFFLVYALWDPPRKHKNFSYEDQQKGVSSAFGGAGPPDLSNLEPQEHQEDRKEHS